MKKLLLVLTLSSLLACKKEDVFSDKVQGKWKVISGNTEGVWLDMTSEDILINISKSYISEPYNMNYSTSENKEIVFSNGNAVMVCFIGDTMRWSFSDGTHLKMSK